MAPRREDRAERLLDLVSFFLHAGGRPVDWEELQLAFPAYAEGSAAARQRKFERDKADLVDLGIPLEWEPGEDGNPGGYVLPREQYYLRQLSLQPDELALLSVAGTVALQQGDFPFRTDLAHALDKLLFVHQGAAGSHAPALRVQPGGGVAAGVVEALGRALAHRKDVFLRYRSFRGEEAERRVSPWGLAWRKGAWFLVGHCHLREAPRTFQAERIVALEVNASRPRQPDYEIPEGFDVAEWVGRAPWQFGVHPPLEVEILLAPEVALLARSRFGEDARIDQEEGGAVSVHLQVRNRDAVVREVLALAPHARVIAPAAFRSEVAAIAERIAAAHEVETEGGAASGAPGGIGAISPAAESDASGAPGPREDLAKEGPPADESDAKGEGPTVRGLPTAGASEMQERIRRALFLVPWAVRHDGATVEELAKAVRLPVEQVLAEIDFLRMIGRPPFSPAEMVDLDVVEGRVRVFLAQGLSRPPSLTPLEAAALDAAASALAAEGGEALARAREKLRAAVPPAVRARFDDLAGRVRLAPAGLPGEVAALLDEAIADRFEIEFTYWTAARAEASRRRVRPLERVLHQGYWYLHAFCCDRRERRLFRLDRAVDFARTDRRFVPRASDDDARFAAGLYTPGARARTCTIRIQPGPWATEETARRIGASDIRQLPDGGALLSLQVDGAAWPVAAVLSLAGEAELLEPADLRERVAALARAAADAHQRA